jgi:hypothetical protein
MCVLILQYVCAYCHICVLILLQGDIMDLNTLTKCILQRAIQVLEVEVYIWGTSDT